MQDLSNDRDATRRRQNLLTEVDPMQSAGSQAVRNLISISILSLHLPFFFDLGIHQPLSSNSATLHRPEFFAVNIN
jgi:hypothetical protein